MPTRIRASALCMLALLAATASGTLAAEPEESEPRDAAPAAAAAEAADPDAQQPGATEPTAADKLSVDQQQIADDFQHFQDLVLRMAELSQWNDARRAALLKRTFHQSQEKLIGVQFESLVELLEKDNLARAIENQENLHQDLEALLDLLLSEDRARRAESEKARIRQYLNRLNRIINEQKSIQGRTAGASPPGPLAEEQQKLADKTGDLGKDIRENEEPAPGSAKDEGAKPPQAADRQDGKPAGEGKEGDPSKARGKQGEKEEPQGKQEGEGKSQPGEGATAKPGESGRAKQAERPPSSQQSQGEGQPGKPDGESQDDQPPQGQPPPQPQDAEGNPARRRIEAAEERMRQAEEKLREAEREGAVEKQEQAIQELEQAKAELERILRQLREEEIERMLTTLATRFKKMLQMQTEVYEGTVRLDKIPEEERTHNQEIEAGRLSRKEAEIVLEADTALAVLRDDGTAAAFPEALQQARDDMRQVVRRLDRTEVGPLTQTIEEEIISALEEMLEALEQAKRDSEEQRPMPAIPARPQDQPLVDLLAEIKMIRAMQMRVNRRTERYSKLIDGEQANAPDLLDALKELAGRQERIHQITRDLKTGRSQ